jgi:hypothetical protein
MDLLGIHFSLYNTLSGPFYLSVHVHNARSNGAPYPNQAAAEERVREVLSKRLPEAKQEIECVEAWLDSFPAKGMAIAKATAQAKLPDLNAALKAVKTRKR